ncbi:hypothetical protein [Sphingomicrobium arenosum]|uniref:hypothetical protein n=1 Tax=Sphingomicrobium arenosum TaxID=2233861 RepID=UPI0022408141|nr:hypothetical protein [Sphingomicrobium arenosum]
MNKRDIIAAGALVLHDEHGPGLIDAGVFPIAFAPRRTGGAQAISAIEQDGGILVLIDNVSSSAFNDLVITLGSADYHLLVTVHSIGAGPCAYDLSFTLLGN